AGVERIVYEEILPRVMVPSLRHYGYLEEPDGQYCWLFMEEATGVDYSNLLAEHRAQAARWLGAVHSLDSYPASRGELPDAGPGRYLDQLRNVREVTQRHLDNPVLSRDDVHFLQGIRTRLDDLAANWDRL